MLFEILVSVFLSLIPIEEGADLLESARTIEPLVAQLAAFHTHTHTRTSSAEVSQAAKGALPVSFLSSARWNGIVVDVVSVCGGLVVIREGHRHPIIARGERRRRMLVPEDGQRVDGRQWEFIGKQGLGMDGGGR